MVKEVVKHIFPKTNDFWMLFTEPCVTARLQKRTDSRRVLVSG